MKVAGRNVPIDLIAFAAIVIAVVATHAPFLHRGMPLNDPGWFFHFGNKTLHGAVPYRDYVLPTGPLPVFVDAAFQAVAGEHYRSSLFAGLFIQTLRVFAVWLLARRIAGWPAALGLCTFCAFDPLFAFEHHWSTPYAELSFVLCALFVVLAREAGHRRAQIYLALSGASAASVFASRPVTAVAVFAVLLAATTALYLRGEYFTRPRLLAWWGGYGATLALMVAVLLLLGALGDGFTQTLLDLPQHQGTHGATAVLDAISGGALNDAQSSWVGGFLVFLGLPCALVAVFAVMASREQDVSTAAIACSAIPVLIISGLFRRYAFLMTWTDLPRIFFTTTTLIALVWPMRSRRWFGLDPVLVVALCAIPLASDWSSEMIAPGRGWGDAWALVTGVILFTLASSRLQQPAKVAISAALAFAAVVHTSVSLYRHIDPFAKPEAVDAPAPENHAARGLSPSAGKVARSMRMPVWRQQSLIWLSSQIPAGSTCFIYGNVPALYDVLGCNNPTRLDDTMVEFLSRADVAEAIEALRTQPPQFIIAHERTWQSPPIEADLGGDITRYESWNASAARALHVGLRDLITQYESVGTVGEALGADLAKQASEHWDALDALRVYRRKN